MTERIGLEAVFDERDFDRGISRYMAALQEATDLTELAASSISDALRSIEQGANFSGLQASTVAVGQAFDALAVNVEGSVQVASEAIDRLALNTSGAAAIVGQSADAMALNVDAASQLASSAVDALALNTNAAADMASLAIRGLATDTIDASNDIVAASDKMAAGVNGALAGIPAAATAAGDGVEKLSKEFSQSADQIKNKSADMAEVAESNARALPAPFSALAGAVSLAVPGVNFFREVTVGAFREVGAIITNVAQNAIQELGAFSAELLHTAAAQTPLIGTLEDLKAQMAGVTLVSLEPLFNQLDTLIQKATPAFLSVLQSAQTYLGETASSAFAWGENIIGQLASGMLAAISSVVSALADIGNLIAFYLMPGSPPRLLPDIDDWGTETAQVWLDGWGKADYGVFDQISGTIEGLIRSLPLGEGSGGDVINRILGSREGIAAAVQELREAGEISEATISGITGAVGGANQKVGDYIRSVAALTVANEGLAAAQDELNRVTQEYDDLLKPIDAALDSIDESQRQLADANRISQLQLVANDPSATLAEKEQARLEIEKIGAEQKKRALLAEKKQAIENAQVAVSVASEAQKQAQESLDQNKARLDFLTEQNRLLQEQARLQEQASAPSGGGGGGRPGLKLPPVGGFGNPFGSMFDEITTSLGSLQSAFGNAFAAIEQTLQPAITAFGAVRSGWDNLVGAFAESAPRIRMYIADAVAFAVRELGITLPTVFKNLGSALDTLAEVWRNHGDTIMAVLNFSWRVVVATVSVAVTAISTLISMTLNSIEGAMNMWSAIFRGQWGEALGAVLASISDNTALAQQALDTMLESILAIFGTDLATLQVLWSETLSALNEYAAQTWDDILLGVSGVMLGAITTVQTGAATIEIVWATLWDSVLSSLKTAWDNITGAINTGIDAAKSAISASIEAFTSLGGNIVDGIKAGIEGAVAGLAAAAAGAAAAALKAAMDALDIKSPSKKAANLVGKPFVQGIESGVVASIPGLQRTVKTASGAMLGAGASTVNNSNNNSRNLTFAPVYNGQPPPQDMDFGKAWALAG